MKERASRISEEAVLNERCDAVDLPRPLSRNPTRGFEYRPERPLAFCRVSSTAADVGTRSRIYSESDVCCVRLYEKSVKCACDAMEPR